VADPLPLPPHWEPDRVSEVWRVDYATRFEEAERWRDQSGLVPAAADRFRVALVVVDVQNTFCTPGFELFVAGRSGTGALDDSRRLCEFIYGNLHHLTQIVPTLDTHQALQIFHPFMLVDEQGRHAEPFTTVTVADVEAGRWRISPPAAEGLGLDADYAEEHLHYYTKTLEEGGKYSLTVWPFHAMLGGVGYALVSAVEEALVFHSIARWAPLDFQPKGDNPLTEHYSMLGPEVEFDREGEPLGRRNHPLVERLLRYDAVVIAGQAKSHCVAWTIQDLLSDPTVTERSLQSKVYLLEDCTSPVVVPGSVDFTDAADEAFQRFAESGAHLVRSKTPMPDWPGVLGEALSLASPR
jgi:nicotinamidase-related amidase